MSHTGWKCPDCGRCYAPFVAECSVCNSHAASAQPHLPFPGYPSYPVIPAHPVFPSVVVPYTWSASG